MDKNYRCLSYDKDWESPCEICKKLSVFYEVTHLFSGSQYPTTSYYFEKFYGIREALLDGNGFLHLNIILMAEKMFVKF